VGSAASYLSPRYRQCGQFPISGPARWINCPRVHIFDFRESHRPRAGGVQVSAFPLQDTFNGVNITVTQGSTVVTALPLYVRQDQINAVMPSNAPLGWVSVRVTFNNAKSNPSPVYVVNDSVGVFTSTGTELGPGAINNFVSAKSQPPNS
jgi:uncharacterized protein (TIGR03437 family)